MGLGVILCGPLPASVGTRSGPPAAADPAGTVLSSLEFWGLTHRCLGLNNPSYRPSLFWTRAPLTPNWDVETNPGSQILVAQDLQNPKLLRDKRMLGSGDEAQCPLLGSPCVSAERTPLLIGLSVTVTQEACPKYT